MIALYLASKEVWRNRGRYFLFSLVIALITILVLFIAALAQGLALANREYLDNLDAELIVFQKNVDLSLSASRIGRSKLNDIRRVEGVAGVGSLGFSSAAISSPARAPGEFTNVSLIGIEPGKPGTPEIVDGKNVSVGDSNEAVIDKRLYDRLGIQVGDTIEIKSIQGTKEKYYKLKVVGRTLGQQYLFQPSIFLPYLTWDKIRPQGGASSPLADFTTNVVAVKLQNPQDTALVTQLLENRVSDIEVVDKQTAIENVPGYSAQQSTLNTQQFFTLLIGILVIGGFFQIQMLQKIPMIGVLKAIGTSNITVAATVVLQIVLVTTFGVLLGSLVTLALSLGLPSNVPAVFNGTSVAVAIISLLMIGPLGGLVSVRLAISVEPLRALGLSS